MAHSLLQFTSPFQKKGTQKASVRTSAQGRASRRESSTTVQEASRTSRSKASQSRASQTRARTKTSQPTGGLRERCAQLMLTVRGRITGPLKILLIMLGILVAAAVTFYSPTRDLYRAWRQKMIYQAELEILLKENESYKEDISRLQTREGIEEEARRRGYVGEGEIPVVVIEDGAQESSVKEHMTQDNPWYIEVGDKLFGYTPENQGRS